MTQAQGEEIIRLLGVLINVVAISNLIDTNNKPVDKPPIVV